MKRLLSAFVFVLAQAGMAPAATMAFDNYDVATADYTARSYSEAGIKATGNAPVIEAFARGGIGKVYLADGGWGGPTKLTFTMDSMFNAVSFDLTAGIFDYLVTNTLRNTSKISSFKNVLIQGFDETGLVASKAFNMGSNVGVATTYALGAAFKNLSSLVIGFTPTPSFSANALGPNRTGQCINLPCSRFRLDNVTLAPVPLPAALSMMLAALAGLAFVARRRMTEQAI
jgi:hypothetical protein